jgi:hypothetical protein
MSRPIGLVWLVVPVVLLAGAAGTTPEEVPIRADEAGASFSVDIRPRISGTYDHQIRYGPAMADWFMHEVFSPDRRFRGPLHGWLGAQFRLEVVDRRTGTPLEPVGGDRWLTMSSSSSDRGRFGADKKTFRLRRGRSYRATLVVEAPSDELQRDHSPRLAWSMTPETSNNNLLNPLALVPPLGGGRPRP